MFDGVYTRPKATARPVFHRLPSPTDADIAALLTRLHRRVRRVLVRRGRWPDDDGGRGPFAAQEPLFAQTVAASLQGRVAFGPRKRPAKFAGRSCLDGCRTAASTQEGTHVDALAQFKVAQRQAWAHFTPFELTTSVTAPRLVAFAGVQAGQRVLDVGCGTGVVAITARRRGAQVTGLDLTPELLQRARENAAVANADVEWHEGDAESLPFGDGAFDVVLSQFGHMFAPRPEVATRDMLRVLKRGGLIAFSTWPPELCIGRIFTLIGRYLPPPPAFVSPPPQWGDPTIVRERLGAVVTDLVFDRAVMLFPTLSTAHYRRFFEDNAGPVLRLVQTLQGEPARLAAFRRELEEIATQYFQDNVVRQDYLMTRATKV